MPTPQLNVDLASGLQALIALQKLIPISAVFALQLFNDELVVKIDWRHPKSGERGEAFLRIRDFDLQNHPHKVMAFIEHVNDSIRNSG